MHAERLHPHRGHVGRVAPVGDAAQLVADRSGLGMPDACRRSVGSTSGSSDASGTIESSPQPRGGCDRRWLTAPYYTSQITWHNNVRSRSDGIDRTRSRRAAGRSPPARSWPAPCSASTRPACPPACSCARASCSASAREPPGWPCRGWWRPASWSSTATPTSWPDGCSSARPASRPAGRRRRVAGPGTGRWRSSTEARRSVAARAELRQAMGALRLAELREGVWLRPDNLDGGWADAARAVVDAQCRRFVSDSTRRRVGRRARARTDGRSAEASSWPPRCGISTAGPPGPPSCARDWRPVVGSLEAGDTDAAGARVRAVGVGAAPPAGRSAAAGRAAGPRLARRRPARRLRPLRPRLQDAVARLVPPRRRGSPDRRPRAALVPIGTGCARRPGVSSGSSWRSSAEQGLGLGHGVPRGAAAAMGAA